MEIKSISEKIFKTNTKAENSSLHTNPFGVSFKGNIITADVFESNEKKEKVSFGAIEKVVKKSKMARSAVVGALNSMNQAFGARMDAIVNFGKTIKANTTKALEYLKNINVKDSLKNSWNYIKENNLKIDIGIVRKQPKIEDLERTFAELVGYKEEKPLEGIV